MKFMNNHYGRSLIFKHARCAVPEDGGDGGVDGGVDGSGGGSGSSSSGEDPVGSSSSEDNSADIEALKLQLAKAQAEKERYKNSVDNLTKKNSELTKKNRQFMTDEQRAQEDQEAVNQELEELRKEVRVSKYSKRFVGMGMSEEEADEMALVMPDMEDADLMFDLLGKFIESVKKTAGADAVQELIKNRPEISAGNGDKKSTVAEDKAVAIAKTRAGKRDGNNIADYYKR